MRAKWNTTLGFRLWCAGIDTGKIGEAVGVSGAAVKKVARRHGWPKRRNYNGRIEVMPIQLTKRCSGCLAIYRTCNKSDSHDCGRPAQSIYEVAA